MKRSISLICTILLSISILLSQQVSTNIDYNTGTAHISLPLGTYETGGYSLPISLEYTASGIRVSQTASWVGMGWELNAGGSVTREIRNLPDDIYEQNEYAPDEKGWLYWNDTITTTLWSALVQNFNFNADDTCQSLCISAIRGDNNGTIHDAEPDIYFFHAGTISGSFIFKPGTNGELPGDREILFLGDQNYQLDYSLNAETYEIDSFTITDDNGIQYIFSEKEYMLSNSTTIVTDTIFFQVSPLHDPIGRQKFLNDQPLNSAEYSVRTHRIEPDTNQVLTGWHLSKIITPYKESITFSYRDEWIPLDEGHILKYRNINSGYNDPIANIRSNFISGNFIPKIKTKKLELICGKNFSIDFVANQTRLDLDSSNIAAAYRPKRLEYIETFVKTASDSIQKKKYSFYYTYPGSYTNEYPVSNDDVTAFERLCLDSLVISNGSLSLPPYKFSYDDMDDLPSRFSYAQDIWGYCNAAFEEGNTTYVPQTYVYKKLSGSDRFRHYDVQETDAPYDVEYVLPGANREANAGYAMLGSLNQITYPTGGYLKLDYEDNQFVYNNGSTEADLTEYDGAGIRISKKTIGDGINSNNDIIEEYIYKYEENNDCSGRLIDIPRYGYFDPTAWPGDTSGYDEDYYNDHYIRTNTNLTKMGDGTISYEEVQIITSGRGKRVITYYTAPSRFSDPGDFLFYDVPQVHTARELEDLYSSPQGTPNMTGIDLTSYAYPFAYNNNYAWNRSLPEQIKEYDENDTLISKIENIYTDYYKNGECPEQVHGMMIDYLWNNGWEFSTSGELKNPLILISKYTINTNVGKRLDTSITTNYDPVHWGRYLVSESAYTYNEYGQLSEVTSLNSDGTRSVVKYRYPVDFNCPDPLPGTSDDYSEAISKMIELNMLNSPIETTTLIDASLTSTPDRYVLGSSLNLPKLQEVNSDTIPMACQNLVFNTASPLSEANYTYCAINAYGILDSIPSGYDTISTVNLYDSIGNLLDANIEHGNHNALIWGYDNSMKIAEVSNASYYETGFTGFEYGETNGWQFVGNISTEERIGSDCRKSIGGNYVARSTGGYVTRTFPKSSMGDSFDEEGGYSASAWVKGGGSGYLKISINTSLDSYIIDSVTNNVADTNWQLLTVHITEQDIDDCPDTILNICVMLGRINSSELLIDEIRFHPTDALMKTYSYKPGFGIISESGPNNVFTYTEYDDLSRVHRVRDHDGNIIINKSYVVNQNLSNGPNSILTQKINKDGILDDDDLGDLKTRDALQTYEYLDGMARSIQTVQKAYSPNSKDFVSFASYNKHGSQDTLWLPYASDESDGSYKTDARGDIFDFYSASGSKIAYTYFPFSEIEYESSPRGMVTETSNPGSSWHLSQGHTKEYEQTFNSGDTVVWFRYNAASESAYTESGKTHYPSNVLSYKEVTDENDETVGVYTDKSGKTIAKFREMTTGSDLWTYYVYDDFGQLVFTISPKAFAQMDSISTYAFSWTSTIFQDLIYGYKYDSKGRITEQKIPGKDKEYFVYDNLNRLILSQDGNLRQSDRWKVNRYDVMGRLIATALETFASPKSQSAMQADVDAFYNSSNKNYEAFVGVDAGHPHGYTNRTYPASIDSNDFLTINYYNDYTFDKNDDVAFTADGDVSLTEYTDRTIGLSTGRKVRILNTSPVNWLLSAVYYDKHQRVVQAISENHLGGYDRISHKRYFPGWISRSKHIHNDGDTSVVEIRYYSLDHRGRITDMDYKIDEDVSFIMYSNKFNELGQVIEKNLHGDIDLLTYWQSIDYKYNIRGWLTNINYSNLNNQNTVISYNQYLNNFEIVEGLVYDTLVLSITSMDTSHVSLGFLDSKYLMITIPDSATSDRNLQYNEQEDVEISDKGQDEFDTYYSYAGETFTFLFDSLHVNENWQLADITDSIEAVVSDQLPSYGITGATETEHLLKAVRKFISDRVALVYFNDDNDDLFGMDILYDEGLSALGGDKQYNGLVSGIRWQAAYYDSIQGYGYEYDHAYRLTDANHGFYNDGWDVENRYGVNSITYDNNGNIMGLQRRGLREYSAGSPVFGQIDDLTYAYKGTNQLNRVDDSRSDGVSVAGNDFKDRGSEADDEYTYDNNGNLITDDNKQITQISYNHLNLPVQITYNANHKIVYLYDALGNKLKKTVYNGQDTIITDYVSNMIYVDGNLEMVMTEEGRMVPLETGGYRAEYFLKDHLGNNRVSFTDTDDDGDADIIQEDHFYPYGMTMGDLSYVSGTKNNFMYQGKEQQDELNLYWYDFGARMFDEQLGRWHVPDPMLQYSSPYVGMGNNPASIIDPSGMWGIGGWLRNLFSSISMAGGTPRNDNYYDDPNWAYRAAYEYCNGGYLTEGDYEDLYGNTGVWVSTGGGGGGGDQDGWQEGPIDGLSYWYYAKSTEEGVTLLMVFYFEESSYYWYQTVSTNSKGGEEGDFFFIDPEDDPWYNSDFDFEYPYFSIGFEDNPNRYDMKNGTYWNAETSLVKKSNGIYTIVATCTWGFGVTGGQFNINPINWTSPSQEHINIMYNNYGIILH